MFYYLLKSGALPPYIPTHDTAANSEKRAKSCDPDDDLIIAKITATMV
ncbi:MAG: hypothetical protein IKH41_03815 [Clostridia bacterium]|nr:hypothetical protein [Clostridia bacterium]